MSAGGDPHQWRVRRGGSFERRTWSEECKGNHNGELLASRPMRTAAGATRSQTINAMPCGRGYISPMLGDLHGERRTA